MDAVDEQFLSAIHADDEATLRRYLTLQPSLRDRVLRFTDPHIGYSVPISPLQLAATLGKRACLLTLLEFGASLASGCPEPAQTLSGSNNSSCTDLPKAAAELPTGSDHSDMLVTPRSDLLRGEFLTDDFRMFHFKITACPRQDAHDWTECPYAHPGEKARRRHPGKHNYNSTPCPDFRKGNCKRGDSCPFAHGVFEAWLHPSKYRTQLCKDGPGCSRAVCFFAHHLSELRTPSAEPNPEAAAVAAERGSVRQQAALANAAAVAAAKLGAAAVAAGVGAPPGTMPPHQQFKGTPTSNLELTAMLSPVASSDASSLMAGGFGCPPERGSRGVSPCCTPLPLSAAASGRTTPLTRAALAELQQQASAAAIAAASVSAAMGTPLGGLSPTWHAPATPASSPLFASAPGAGNALLLSPNSPLGSANALLQLQAAAAAAAGSPGQAPMPVTLLNLLSMQAERTALLSNICRSGDR